MNRCSMHKLHAPANHTIEEHHVIPQAWQHFKLGTEELFDKRTVPLCPTGHRNVHDCLVRLMKGLPPGSHSRQTVAVARLAISRFEEAGGDVQALRGAKVFGYA